MTYQGAIDELKSLENNESMPDWFKPTLKKVRETMEMDGRENIHGEWIQNFLGIDICSKCGEPMRDRRVNHINFCNCCGADMRGKQNETDN